METRSCLGCSCRIASLSERICVIVNPASGGGRGAKMLPQIRSALPSTDSHRVAVTCAADNERQLAEDAIRDGFSTILCAGGDGTCSNVANAILNARSEARLGVIPLGTGNDFARTLGLERASLSEVVDLAVSSASKSMDVGKVDDVFFLNSCGFGFDVAVVLGLTRARWLGRRFVYIYSALREIVGYGGIEATITNGSRISSHHLLIVLANGSRFGGGLVIAPSASVTDGMLDAVAIRDASPTRRLRMFAAATTGTHERFAEVTIERAESFALEFKNTPIFESDGELHQANSSTVAVECRPRALNVVAGRNFG